MGTGLNDRHVYHSSYQVWRDIERFDENNNPICDSCFAKTPKPSPIYHKYDYVLVDQMAGSGSDLVWPVCRITQVLSRERYMVQPFRRYSSYAAEADSGNRRGLSYVSEVSVSTTEYQD